MNHIRIFTATAPAHWASYLVNGDASGIDEADIAAADTFLDYCLAGWEKEGGEAHGPTDVEECGFMHSTDGSNLGCEAAQYTFVVRYPDSHEMMRRVSETYLALTMLLTNFELYSSLTVFSCNVYPSANGESS